MNQIDFIDIDLHIALIDIERHRQGIARECLEVWDSMSGRLPGFEGYCRMYMKEKFGEWCDKARWN